MEFETTQGKLYYELSGEGRPLLLLHGNGEDHHIFDAAQAVLADHFQVYSVDSPGHGQSFPLDEYHYRDMAGRIGEMIEGLGLQKPIVCGFSDGGILALLMAIARPELLGGVIACGVNTHPRGVKWFWRVLFRLQYMFQRLPLLALMLHEPDITREELVGIRCPVWVCGGSRDMITQKHLKTVAEQIPGAQLHILPGEDHGSYIIGSTKIADVVLSFAKENP